MYEDEQELFEYFAAIEEGRYDPNFTPVFQSIADFDRKLLGLLNQSADIISVYTLANAQAWYTNLYSRHGVANNTQLAAAFTTNGSKPVTKAEIDDVTRRLDGVVGIISFLNDNKSFAFEMIPDTFK